MILLLQPKDNLIDLLLKLLNDTITGCNTINMVDFEAVNLEGNPKASTIANDCRKWIVDSGASQYVTSNLELLNGVVTLQDNHRRKVYLPNVESIVVTDT